jgi:hypothetical protein
MTRRGVGASIAAATGTASGIGTARAATASMLGVTDDGFFWQDDQVEFQNRYFLFAARRAFQNTDPRPIRLDSPYLLNISPVTPWLSSVERRIEDSIVPIEYEGLSPTQWLREEVGQAAIRFFQNTADVLPVEPFLYGSQTGALVAEFVAKRGTLTTVVSPNTVIVFAVKADEPDTPVQVTLKRGSNLLREELQEIVKALAGPHGQMGSTS